MEGAWRDIRRRSVGFGAMSLYDWIKRGSERPEFLLDHNLDASIMLLQRACFIGTKQNAFEEKLKKTAKMSVRTCLITSNYSTCSTRRHANNMILSLVEFEALIK